MTKDGRLELHVLRHAHSSRAIQGQRDHQRPLDDHGRREAARLGEHLAKRALDLRQILCSTATRAVATLEIVRPALGRDATLETSDDLYALGRAAYYAATDIYRQAGSLLLVGHNPMIAAFVLELCTDGSPDAMREAKQGFSTACWAIVDLRFGRDPIAPGDGFLREIVRP